MSSQPETTPGAVNLAAELRQYARLSEDVCQGDASDVMIAAADEIERLRKEIERIQAGWDECERARDSDWQDAQDGA